MFGGGGITVAERADDVDGVVGFEENHGGGAASDGFVEEGDGLLVSFINTEGAAKNAVAELGHLEVDELSGFNVGADAGRGEVQDAVVALKIIVFENGCFFLNHYYSNMVD